MKKPFDLVLGQAYSKREVLVYNYLKERGYDFVCNERLHHGIPDFYFPKHRLIVEIDGNTHNGTAEQQRDRDRDIDYHFLEITVVRYRNEAIDSSFEGVMKNLERRLAKRLLEIESWSRPVIRRR